MISPAAAPAGTATTIYVNSAALEWGGIRLYNGSNGTTHLVLDVFGYYNPLGSVGATG